MITDINDPECNILELFCIWHKYYHSGGMGHSYEPGGSYYKIFFNFHVAIWCSESPACDDISLPASLLLHRFSQVYLFTDQERYNKKYFGLILVWEQLGLIEGIESTNEKIKWKFTNKGDMTAEELEKRRLHEKLPQLQTPPEGDTKEQDTSKTDQF